MMVFLLVSHDMSLELEPELASCQTTSNWPVFGCLKETS